MAKDNVNADALEGVEETKAPKAKKEVTQEEIDSVKNAIAVLSGAGVLSEKMAKVAELAPMWHDTDANAATKEEVMEFFGGSDKLKDYVDGEYQEELVALTGFAKLVTILNNVKSFYARRSTKRPSKASVQVTISGNLYSVNKAYLESTADMDKEARREALLAHAETKPVETIESLQDIDSQKKQSQKEIFGIFYFYDILFQIG